MNMDFNEAQDWVGKHTYDLAELLTYIRTSTFSCEKCGQVERYPANVTACTCPRCQEPMVFGGIIRKFTYIIDGIEVTIREN